MENYLLTIHDKNIWQHITQDVLPTFFLWICWGNIVLKENIDIVKCEYSVLGTESHTFMECTNSTFVKVRKEFLDI